MANTAANVLVGLGVLSFAAENTIVGGAWTEVGYIDDGVNLEYGVEASDVNVDQEDFPIDRVITAQSLSVTCNLAESSLVNIDQAMAGGVLAGAVITIGAAGGDSIKKLAIKIVGTNPAGAARTIWLPSCTATGTVGMAYKKGDKTMVPATFSALKGTNDVCTITDS